MKTPFLVSLVFALAIGLVSGRASELVLPDDPFRFPVLPDGRIDSVARLVGSAAGVPVTITGPYIAEHLTWISKNGRKMEGSHTVFRDDILDTDALKQLLAWVTPQREVFFYAWGKDPMIHLEWGYAVIEGDRLVHRMILGQELN